MKDTLTIQCFISGHVQGVWFRAHTKEQADKLDITGFAKNLSDGRVEVVATGEHHNIKQLYEWLKKGPEQAEVHDITYDEIPLQKFDDFKKM